jgi:sugar (pentulose or hexulose) kinase
MATDTMAMYMERRSQDKKAVGRVSICGAEECVMFVNGVDTVLRSFAAWSRASEALFSNSKGPSTGRSLKTVRL